MATNEIGPVYLYQNFSFHYMSIKGHNILSEDEGFETRERKIQAQTDPRLQWKNFENWMELNLGYAPVCGLI